MDEAAMNSPPLERLPYQAALCDFLRRTDSEVWQWFASRPQREKQAEDARFELLKQTYRVDRDAQPELYAALDEVAKTLGVDAPATIYQAQHPRGLNAALVYMPGEVHLIFEGPIAEQLEAGEMRALLAHELCHFLLFSRFDGEMLVADEMLHALVNDRHAHPAHYESLRLLRLYNEIYCDRGALAVCGDLHAVVSTLVKIETNVKEVSAAAYLRQADEIFARGPLAAEGISHPEVYIRARAARLWSERSADANEQIRQMLEGPLDLAKLDLLAQERVDGITRRLLDAILAPPFMQTDILLAHARLFFDKYAWPSGPAQSEDILAGETLIDSLRDYLAYVLLDFAAADRELEDAPLAHALLIAEAIGCEERLLELARQELKLRKGQLDKLAQAKEKIVADAVAEAETRV